VTFDPTFQGHDIFFEVEYRKTARLKDKVTIAQYETIPNIWNCAMFGDLDRLTSKRVAQVCQHQPSFLLTLSKICLTLIAFKTSANTSLVPEMLQMSSTSLHVLPSNSSRLVFLFFGKTN